MDNKKLQSLSKLASEYYGVSLDKLMSGDRRQKYVIPRRCCMFIAFDAGYTKPDIAEFWKCDRTTVHSACNRYEHQVSVNPRIKKELIQFSEFVKKFLEKT